MPAVGCKRREAFPVPLTGRSVSALLLTGITFGAALTFAAFAWLQHSRGAVFNSGDPIGYYVYLRSLVHDGDLDFTNDYAFFQPSIEIPGMNMGRTDPVTGRPDNNYTIGLPLLIAPLYAAATVLLAGHYPARGVVTAFPLFLDELIFSYGGLVVAAAGIWLAFRFVSLYFPEPISLAATIVFWLCGPLLYYTAREPFQSHSASVFAVSSFLYVWKIPSLRVPVRWALMGMSGALVVMTRQQDGVVLLIPVGAALMDGGWRSVQRRLPALPFAVIGFLALFVLQMGVWYLLRGSLLTYAYRGQEFTFLSRPRIADVLFSSNHGLISWHPIIAVCLMGLMLLSVGQHATLGRLSLACFVTELYVAASWWCWWMGNSFGQRGFLNLTPVFILGLAAVITRLTHRWQRRLFLACAGGLFLWNVVLMFAYLAEMVPYQGEFSWVQLITKLPELPSKVLGKAKVLSPPAS